MAEDIDSGGEAAKPPEAAKPDTDAKSELPEVDSPTLSPASEAPESRPEPASALLILPPASEAGARAAPPRLRIRPRHWRQAVLAASVMAAAAFGVVVGSQLTGAPSAPQPDVASLHREQAMQQTVDHLGKEIAALKVNLAASRKAANSEIAKITDRLRPAPDITGSIPKPPVSVPTPPPRPAMPLAVSRVLPDWTIHDVYHGNVYVRGHGDIYQAARGAPLPGLGPITAIERRAGRWVVVTPRGLIVSLRDRHYFETN